MYFYNMNEGEKNRELMESFSDANLFDICDGAAHEPLPYSQEPGTYEVIAFSTTGEPDYWGVPLGLGAKSVESTHLVLCRGEFHSELYEVCDYLYGRKVETYQATMDVALYEIATGDLIASETISYRTSCLITEEFGEEQIIKTKKVFTLDIKDKVEDWVRNYAVVEVPPTEAPPMWITP